jgi:hypothetical protein
MASPSDVLQQLNDKLFTKQYAKKPQVEISDDNIDESQAAKRFIGHYVRRGQGEYRKGNNDDEFVDVDTIQAGDVDDDYETHKPIVPAESHSPYIQTDNLDFGNFLHKLKRVTEQRKGGPGIDTPEEVGAAAAGGDPSGGGADTPEEAQMQAQGQQIPEDPMSGMPPGEMPPEAMDPGMGQPLPEEDTSKSPSDLGRIYELKKIYTRLTVIEAYLTESSDPSMIETRTIVSKAIELFEILASNLSSYKPPRAPEETLDEIIVQYYRFIEKIYNETANYYKRRSREHITNDVVPPEKPKIKVDVYNP